MLLLSNSAYIYINSLLSVNTPESKVPMNPHRLKSIHHSADAFTKSDNWGLSMRSVIKEQVRSACSRLNSVDVMRCVTKDCSPSVLRPQRALNTNAITQSLDQHQALIWSADDTVAVGEPRVEELLS